MHLEEAQNAEGLLHLLLDIGEMLLSSGAEVNRVEDTLSRMGKAYGAKRMNVFVITSSIVVTMQYPDGREVTQTRRILESGGTNFFKLEKLNDLSRRCSVSPMPLDELKKEIKAMNTGVSRPMTYVVSMLAAGAFALFFGGSLADGLVAAVFAAMICFLQEVLSSICPNKVIFNLLTSMLVGICICLLAKVFPGLQIDKIMIGDIMLLIPGIAMTNSVRDILVGDTISGLMRLVESLLWAGALACGFMAAIWMRGG